MHWDHRLGVVLRHKGRGLGLDDQQRSIRRGDDLQGWDEQNGCRLWNPRCYPELLDDNGCVVVAVLWLDSVFLPPRDFLPEGTPAGQWLKHHASQNSFGLGTRTIVMTTTFGLFTGIIPPSDE